MATIIELKQGELPRHNERYAIVLVSDRPPQEGVAISLNGVGRIFYAYDNLTDITAVLSRAVTWADENIVARVYLRNYSRDAVNLAPRRSTNSSEQEIQELDPSAGASS